jgi:hypothetical protein
MRELKVILAATRSIEAGKFDHLFANTETKAAMRADLNRQAIELIELELKENPGLYRQLPDGQWEIFPEAERRVIPLRRH